MKLSKGKVYTINYIKDSGEVSTRDIVPLTEVAENVTTIDLTGLDELERKYIVDKQLEYNEYVKHHMQSMFNFKTWFEHTYGNGCPEKLLNFKVFKLKNMALQE